MSCSIVAIAGPWCCSGSASSPAIGSRTSPRTPTPSSKSFYAVPQLGAVLVPVNYRLTTDDFAYIISHSGAVVVCAAADHLAAIDGIRDRLPCVSAYVALEAP